MLKPVFIIGCPRSGTTITLDLLSVHEGFAWVSNLLNEAPTKPELASFNRIFDDSVRGRSLLLQRRQVKTLPAPVEPWKFWCTYLQRFRWKPGGPVLPRRQNEKDISSDEVTTLRFVMDAICRYQQKDRLLSKYTDFPRIKYLTQAFPDAIFLHMVRDGRAVAYSYYEQIKGGSWRTWEEHEWWVRGWPDRWRYEWLEKYNSPLAFLAYQWKFFVNEIWKDAQCLPSSQFVEIQYRDLVKSPKIVLAKIFEICGLGASPRAEWYADQLSLTDMNVKWRQALTAQEKIMLDQIISEESFRRCLDP